MRMPWLALMVACLLCWSAVLSPAIAQTLRGEVQSGRHDGFDRIVISLDRRPGWRIDEETGSSLIFEADALDLDVGALYARIGRDRITALDIDGAALRFTLGCACRIRAFDLGDRRVVVEVIDDGAPRTEVTATQPVTAPDPLGAAPVSPGYLPTALGILPAADRLFLDLSPPDRALDIARPDVPPPSEADPLPQLAAAVPGSEEEAPALSAFEGRSARDIEMLSEALGTASARGIADASSIIDEIDTILSGTPNRPGLSVRSVFDSGAADSTRIISADSGCQPRDLHDLAAWYEEEPSTLGGARAAVIDDRHRFVAEEIHRLSRFYLTRGFGSEARQLQGHLPEEARQPTYLAIADILDTGSTRSTAFEGQLLCPGGAALWAVFAADFKPHELAGGNPAILRAFSTLPAAVRLQLGQELSARLRQAGRSDDAEVVENAVARTGSVGTGDYRHAASRLGIGGRDTAVAIAELEAMIRSTDANAGQALVALFEHAATTGAVPDPHWVEHAEPLIRANRGNPTSARLRVLWLRGLIDSDMFTEARDAYHMHRAALSDSERGGVLNTLVAAASERASDAQFLEIAALLQVKGDIGALALGTQAAFRERLTLIGAEERDAGLSLAALPPAPPAPERGIADPSAAETPDAIARPREMLETISARREEIAASLGAIDF